MRVDIWSDIMCPFCYIGKRQFDNALAAFGHSEEMEVVWHSYQLDPTVQYTAGKDLYTYLAERKGQTREWSVRVHESVTEMAKSEGLDYRFDIAKVANSFDAHRVIQYAKTVGKDDATEERFFRAYFTEGAVMSDYPTLARLASEAGLDADEVMKILNSSRYAKEVDEDISTAERIGVNGVPFFVLDNKYAISGAQGTATFLGALDHLYKELHPADMNSGPACTPGKDGEC